MILAVAVCPCSPALVPELAPGAEAELGEVRACAEAAVRDALTTGPDRVVVLGADAPEPPVDERAGGTLRSHGIDVSAGGADLVLAPGLTVGAWLLDRVGWSGPRTYTTSLAPTDEPIAVLVMADGSARRALTAPGYLDERAEGFDQVVTKALANGDAATLVDLDLVLAGDLLAAGAPTLAELGRAVIENGRPIRARVRYDAAPLGVGYWVADWRFGDL